MTFLSGIALRERVAAACALVCLVTATGAVAARPGVQDGPTPASETTQQDAEATRPATEVTGADRPAIDPSLAGAATTARPVVVREAPDGRSREVGRLRAGILLPVTGTRNGFVQVLTPCQKAGWVSAADVGLHERGRGDGRGLRGATVVVDPGHGGIQPGATGVRGLTEAAVNQAIVARTVQLLEADGVRVFRTISADYTAGLGFRTTLANTLRADVFMSVHNNADPDGPSEGPGAETYYQLRRAASKRLAGLAYEEIISALGRHKIAWVADRDAGAKYRTNSRGEDYYAVLRRTQVPAVLVEATFISNPPEEALLRSGEVQRDIAGALHRTLGRYLTTDDPGSGFTEPYARGSGGPSGQLPGRCTDPI
jgi:N-acetylmuramoyl-L-alanine amidase